MKVDYFGSLLEPTLELQIQSILGISTSQKYKWREYIKKRTSTRRVGIVLNNFGIVSVIRSYNCVQRMYSTMQTFSHIDKVTRVVWLVQFFFDFANRLPLWTETIHYSERWANEPALYQTPIIVHFCTVKPPRRQVFSYRIQMVMMISEPLWRH